MFRLAISEFSTYRWSLEQEIREMSRRGIRQIGLWRTKLSDLETDAASDLLYAADLRVSSLSWAGGFTGTCGMSFEEAVEDATVAIRIAARMGAGCLIVHPGSRGNHTRNHACKLFRTALDRLLPIAADYGVVLGIETMDLGQAPGWTIMDTHQQVFELVRRYATPNLAVVLDLFFAGDHLSLLESLPEPGSRIALVQIADRTAVGDGSFQRSMPGEGTVDFQRWFDALESSGYQGVYEFELHGPRFGPARYWKLLDDAVAFLKQLSEQSRRNPSMSPTYRSR